MLCCCVKNVTFEYNCFKRSVDKSSYRLLLLPHKKSIFDSDSQADDVDLMSAVGRCKDGKNTLAAYTLTTSLTQH